MLCPGKGLVLPTTIIDTIAIHSRFLFLSLPNNEMSRKSPFAIQKALKGIGGDPKSVKKLRSGDLLIETVSALQSKFFLLARTFIDYTLTVTPHKSLNSCRGVISEPDLLCASEAEILEGLSDHGVNQPNTFPSMPSVPTSSYQANILPSASSIKPTTQIESRLPEPISDSAAAPDNSLNTSASSSSVENRSLTT
ncbi:uncharacterized protein TNCV_131791 [Trichonephila clavipes]|nr:uncharacterized protein TNCV_131791 [Trichonephila clavipes]